MRISFLAYGIFETSEYPQTWPDEVVSSYKKISEHIDSKISKIFFISFIIALILSNMKSFIVSSKHN